MINITATLGKITWDTDGEDVKLPKTFKVDFDIELDTDLEMIHEEAMDQASDKTGWCISECYLMNVKINH